MYKALKQNCKNKKQMQLKKNELRFSENLIQKGDDGKDAFQ